MQQEPGINSTLVSRFADIYSETISTLQPRIIVKGNPEFLQQDNIVNRIRCLLLAGARAAVLWEQLGGGTDTVSVTGANSLLATAEEILQRRE